MSRERSRRFRDYNTKVHKGQLCAKIDPAPYRIIVDEDHADLATARAQLAKVVVQPGATTAGGVRAGAGSASTLTVADAETIQRDDPAASQVSYLVRQSGQVEYGDQNWTTAIQGVTPSYLDIVSWRVAEGASMTEQENDAADTVVLIGQTV